MNTLVFSYIQQTAGVDNMSLVMFFLIFLAFAIGMSVNHISLLRIRKNSKRSKEIYSIMQHTLQASNNYVLRLDLRSRYAKNMYGNFIPEEGMSYEESLEYIHPEDRHLYQQFLKKLINGAKTADCTFRWDRSQKNHEEDWRYIHDVGIAEYANAKQKVPIGFFCTLTDDTTRAGRADDDRTLSPDFRLELGRIGLR